MQRPRCSIDDVQKELLDVLEDYFGEAESNESNTEN
jgi:hypothetical protein